MVLDTCLKMLRVIILSPQKGAESLLRVEFTEQKYRQKSRYIPGSGLAHDKWSKIDYLDLSLESCVKWVKKGAHTEDFFFVCLIKQQIYFLQFWRSEVWDQGASLVCFLVKSVFLVYRWPAFCFLLRWREKASSLSGVLFFFLLKSKSNWHTKSY